MALAAPLIGRFGRNKHHARVGGAAGKAETHDGEGSGNVRILADDGLGAIGQSCCVGQRRARRSLHDDHEEALIFLWDEAGGNVLISPHCCAQAGEEYDEQHIAQAQRDMDRFCIGAG